MKTEQFITDCINSRRRVSIFLVNGVALKGVIATVSPDMDSLTLVGDGAVAQLIMIRSIATIMPNENFGNR